MKANRHDYADIFSVCFCMQLMVFFIAIKDVYDKHQQCSVIKHTKSECVFLMLIIESK